MTQLTIIDIDKMCIDAFNATITRRYDNHKPWLAVLDLPDGTKRTYYWRRTGTFEAISHVKNDKPNGPCIIFFKNGKVKAIETYEDGICVSKYKLR